ncbi:2,4'-dihydroxyacetophenone dioxygenase family protein [Streptomyces sp. NPDC014870]|uniref:2,4'-dihydroxyacetophenone dioxygenase family protein n=1 Tax=Streptomyces sp. NPDC014870 TaxID=3364925 RepID=UPI0036FC7A37
MPNTPSPVGHKTRAGADLPIVALPQGELLTVSDTELPLLKDAMGPGIDVQIQRLDVERGEWVVKVTYQPGVAIPMHHHTGIAEVWTLAGSWHYAEYPDQPQTAGSYLYEPGGSVHTLIVPETNNEATVQLVRVSGANVNFNEDGTFHSILDAVSIRFLGELLAAGQGVESLGHIDGGAAGKGPRARACSSPARRRASGGRPSCSSPARDGGSAPPTSARTAWTC